MKLFLLNLGRGSVVQAQPCPSAPPAPPRSTTSRANLWLMRISLAYSILIATSIQLAARTTSGQTIDKELVTIEVSNGNVEQVVKLIEAQSSLRFIYLPEQVNKYGSVTLVRARRTVRQTLDIALSGTGLGYEQSGSYVVLRERRETASVAPGVTSPVLNASLVKGRVTDQDGQGIAGVNIIVKGTTNGTTTDGNGDYALTAESTDVLVFSFIGYKSQEVSVASRTTVDVGMELDVAALKVVEVRGTGYWEVDEKKNTGNISKITAEDIGKQPVANPIAAMEGRMPGVDVQQTTGMPGGGFNIQIRGRSSLRNDFGNNGNLPLYIVDGVPFTSSSYSSGYLTSSNLNGGNPLSAINPADIASIEVLKDADATAIYGSRGANGVVLIKTKRGRSGKPRFDMNFYRGFGKVSRMMKLMNTEQYVSMRKEAFKNDNFPVQPYDYDVDGTWDTTRYTDWQKKLIGGTSQYTNLQGSVSGGSDVMRFLLGGAYFNETTVFPAEFGNKKASVNLNLSYADSQSKFSATSSVIFVNNKNNLPTADMTSYIFLPPNAPNIYNDDGSLNWDLTWPFANNPYSALRRKYIENVDNLVANVNLGYELVKGLSIKANMGYNSLYAQSVFTDPLSSHHPLLANILKPNSYFYERNSKSWIIEPKVEYNKNLGPGDLSVLVGSTLQRNDIDNSTLYATGYANDLLIENLANAPSITAMGADAIVYKYSAMYGRVNYVFKDKYIVNITGRRDGSSKFGPNNRFANFGAIGAAWVFSEESFMKDAISFFSFAKIRGSYGITGSDQIPDYGYFDTYGSTYYSYNGSPGLISKKLANPNYSWEKNKKAEVALEMGILNDKIRLNMAYYQNRSSNQLVGYPLAPSAGFTTVQDNLNAVVQNTGWEFELRSQLVQNELFSWQVSVNATVPRNKLISFPNLAGSSYVNTYEVGRSLYARRLYHYTGVNPETGLYTFEDVDKNGVYNEKDFRTYFTGRNIYGGIQNSISFKGFQIDFLFQFVKQTGQNYLSFIPQVPGSLMQNQPVAVEARWRTAGDVTNVQRYTQATATEYMQAQSSDLSIGDASFIRLKNVSISYSVPKSLINKVRLDNLRVYVQGQNLLTFTDYVGADPETMNPMLLPALRVITFGVNMSL